MDSTKLGAFPPGHNLLRCQNSSIVPGDALGPQIGYALATTQGLRLAREPGMGHWLVIDLEATTDDGGWPVTEMEIIEIGASLVTREGREIDHFQRFVRPRRRPQLTPSAVS